MKNCLQQSTGLFSCKSNSVSYERFCRKTPFETEAQDNSEMAYLLTRGRNLKGEEWVGMSLGGGAKSNFEGEGQSLEAFQS